MQLENVDDGPQEVLILRGGFTEFQEKFKVARPNLFRHSLNTISQDDPKLIEKWSKDIWGAVWSF